MSCCGKDSLAKRLNKRGAILRKSGPEDLDEAGQQREGLIPVATVWAAVEPLRGREFFSAQAVNSEVTTRIRIRYRPGVDRTMFFRCQGIDFEILYTINPNLANIELQLMSKEQQ